MSVVVCVCDANRDLRDNQLTTLPEGIFDSLTSLSLACKSCVANDMLDHVMVNT